MHCPALSKFLENNFTELYLNIYRGSPCKKSTSLNFQSGFKLILFRRKKLSFAQNYRIVSSLFFVMLHFYVVFNAQQKKIKLA